MLPRIFSQKSLLLFFLFFLLVSACVFFHTRGSDTIQTVNTESPQIVSKGIDSTVQNKRALDAEKNSRQKQGTNKPENAAPKRIVTEEERILSSKILSFFNQVENKCTETWSTEADRLAFFVRIYLGEWQLPKFVAQPVSRTFFHQKLDPPAELAGEFDGKSLRNAVDALYDASVSMKKKYKELERYVVDYTIVDEGVLGKRLSRQILDLYGQFCKARKTYFFLLEERALRAEDIFLEDFPLKRQIQESRKIFALFRDISFELSKEETSWVRMRELGELLAKHLHEAEKPPFKDKPLKERAFRAFIRDVHTYYDHFEKGIAEGFYTRGRKALNDDVSRCRSSYNAFVEYSNENTHSTAP